MPGTRQATLEAMGYVCEEMATIKDEVLSPQEINQILTAVVAGMGATEPDETRLAATEALHNAIEFAQHNFDNDNERNYLMQVSEAATCSGSVPGKGGRCCVNRCGCGCQCKARVLHERARRSIQNMFACKRPLHARPHTQK
jgi:hypothetical protein